MDFCFGNFFYLLRIKNVEQLKVHPLRGSIFENWVISEYVKSYYNKGEEAPLYFWRDQHGHEIDLVFDGGLYLDFTEIKSSTTFHKDFLKNINWINNLQGSSDGTCIYGGTEKIILNNSKIIPWTDIFTEDIE